MKNAPFQQPPTLLDQLQGKIRHGVSITAFAQKHNQCQCQ